MKNNSPNKKYHNDSQAILQAYQQLKATVLEAFDERVWFMTRCCLSVIGSLSLRDASNPVGLILIDGPSSEKTTVLSFFYDIKKMIYRTDNFTPAAFVSHASNVKKEKLEENDLLPKIRHKCLILPELAPLFSQDRENLMKSMAILTRIFDGEGYLSDSGVHGSRGYTGDYYFSMLGASTPFSKNVWNVMGRLGSRLLFLTPVTKRSDQIRLSKSFIDVFGNPKLSYMDRVNICRSSVNQYFEVLAAELGSENICRTVNWSRAGDSRDVQALINLIADVGSKARSHVSVWEKTNSIEEEFDHSQPMLEMPHRMSATLYNLARGHAVVSGRSIIGDEDLEIVLTIALSSMPDNRRRAFSILLDPPGELKHSERGVVTSSDLERCLLYSRPTAIKVLNELALLEIGHIKEGYGNEPTSLKLKDIYLPLLEDDILRLRTPWDRSENDSKSAA